MLIFCPVFSHDNNQLAKCLNLSNDCVISREKTVSVLLTLYSLGTESTPKSPVSPTATFNAESREVSTEEGHYSCGPPAHRLLSRNVVVDSLQLRAQEAGQQLENKVLLLLTGNVPTHTQCRHVSRSPPVLQWRERETLRCLAEMQQGGRRRERRSTTKVLLEFA